ncbi:DUF3558 domain-containing protein [Haloechinothrix sp. LS1_15]|uniref:DUF3558 domain-containing protein n=1 Tax=Haloechinothrix sp. LS1_15 TaxID=2652248 RepID=UPI00294AF50C|nr:DUF3558 domain-containing protein [Haloechinothrix sp. LS1_15]
MAALLVAGCSGDPGGSADADGDNEQQGSAELPHSGAPAVEDPIVADIAPYEDDPCRTIDDALLAEAGFTYEDTAADTDVQGDPICHWHASDGSSYGVTVMVSNTEGLSGIYANHAGGGLGLFEELDPVSGYPAVAASQSDARDIGICTVAVGIRDDLAVSANFTVGTGEDARYEDTPCQGAHELAEVVVATLQGES